MSTNKKKNSSVNKPAHYTCGSIECIDAIEAAIVNLKGIEAADTANAIKYLWRWKEKNGVEDLKKAKWYINHLIKILAKENGAQRLANKSFYDYDEDLKAVKNHTAKLSSPDRKERMLSKMKTEAALKGQ